MTNVTPDEIRAEREAGRRQAVADVLEDLRDTIAYRVDCAFDDLVYRGAIAFQSEAERQVCYLAVATAAMGELNLIMKARSKGDSR